MFCSECGTKAHGKFCFQCGAALQSSTDVLLLLKDQEIVEAECAPNFTAWEHDARYENIVRVEVVRTTIAQHAIKASKGLSGEQILALYDKVIASPVPLEKLAGVIQPLYASWGVRTGKERVELINAPIGRTIARTLCSLAKHSQTFDRAEQHETGCILYAELPSSLTALKGQLIISLLRHEQQTQVTASTNIPGQFFDWGKSTRALEQFFTEIRTDLGLPLSLGSSLAA